MVARSTPPCTDCRQASILGIMPASRLGSSALSSVLEMRAMTSELAGQSAYSPSTSVSTTNRSAFSATASAPAAVSAFTLCTLPSSSGATVAITGMRPASIRSSTVSGRTWVTSPTRPMSCSSPSMVTPRRVAVNSPASSPDRPTASGPWALSRPTSSRPTCPTSTMRTTSMASGEVTRSPPLNSDVMPSRPSIDEICGPPPCTTTGFRPHLRRNTMSSAKARLRSSLIIALPPYLTTITLPTYRSSHGSASIRVSALAMTCAAVSRERVVGVMWSTPRSL